MSDIARVNAERRREEIASEINSAQQRIEDLRRELAQVDGFIQAWHAFAGLDYSGAPIPKTAAEMVGSPSTNTVRMSSAKKVVDNPKKEAVVEKALELIRERGVPIAKPELYEKLIFHGIVVNGTDPLSTLSTMLWRMRNRIAHIHGHGYWPADVPYLPAGYLAGVSPDEPVPTLNAVAANDG